MFPTNSYNTPHGYQFGREAAEFNEDSINPNIWDEALSERSFEQTDDYDAQRIQRERARAEQESRLAAVEYAAPVERISTRERDIADAHAMSDVGRHIRFNRDYVKGDFGLAA